MFSRLAHCYLVSPLSFEKGTLFLSDRNGDGKFHWNFETVACGTGKVDRQSIEYALRYAEYVYGTSIYCESKKTKAGLCTDDMTTAGTTLDSGARI